MKVLVLSPYPERLHKVFRHDQVVPPNEDGSWPEVDYVVSYGWRHLIQEPELSKYKDKILNVHIGYLPYNRGADPNFWSWFDNTPKGVTVHFIDGGIDTGDIVAQYKFGDFQFDVGMDTLETSYHRLQLFAETLFHGVWTCIKDKGGLIVRPQPPGGSYHRAKDKDPFMKQLPDGWQSRVRDVIELGKKHRG